MECVFSQDLERGKLSILQTTFTGTLARRFDVTITSLYPACSGEEIGARMESESGGTRAYRETVTDLMWLTAISRTDIANAVRAVACHPHNPTARHWKSVLMVVKYLLGTKGLGLLRLNGGRD